VAEGKEGVWPGRGAAWGAHDGAFGAGQCGGVSARYNHLGVGMRGTSRCAEGVQVFCVQCQVKGGV